MDKTHILDTLVASVESDLSQATEAALESAESATHEEARSEGKYDTRGLETSYLATGQAKHAAELQESLAALKQLSPPEFGPDSPIALGALVTVLSTSGREVYFLAPGIGGLEIDDGNGNVVTTISPKSPLGRELIGKRTGERIQTGGGKTILSIA